MALRLGKVGEVLALHPLVRGVVAGHWLSPSVESQFALGFAVSSILNAPALAVLSGIERVSSYVVLDGDFAGLINERWPSHLVPFQIL